MSALASARSLLRAARDVINSPVEESAAPLEAQRVPADPPRLSPATPIEQGFFARAVDGEAVAFRGFLDGVQDSRVVAWLPSAVPMVLVTVGAVALVRGTDRRLVAARGGARLRRVIVLPRALTDPSTWNTLSKQVPLEDSGSDASVRHPETLLTNAIECAERLRTAEERGIAEDWVRSAPGPLAADGSLANLGAAAQSRDVVGIVKSHRTLYLDGPDLPALFALRVGERTRAFTRGEVVSWYLRLREGTTSSPLHGVVRVETCRVHEDLTRRADDVSRWIMAERTPVALPDARWDVMAYGIARCEAYLKRGLALRSTA